MLEIKNKIHCSGCSACAQACPKQCIAMRADAEGFLYPVIDQEICIDCGRCERVCPILHPTAEPENKAPQAYAAYNKDEQVRLQSSSGGVFTLLGEEILAQGGVVFGAALTQGCRKVRHIAVEDKKGLALLRGSKYLQSEIGNTFCEAQDALKKGRKVLFSGTPCEIEGLKSFLGKEYENLICVDLVCHGAPSQKVWEKYVSYQENRASAPAQRALFRYKKYGWKRYSILLEHSNNTAYEQIFSKDLFMQMFLQNLCLRPSCYSCAFKKVNRVSDITLADFWGCEQVCPDLNDDKGLSLILVHSVKGKALFEKIGSKLCSRAVDCAEAVKQNPSFTQSVKEPKIYESGRN